MSSAKPLAPDEIQARRTWAAKSLDRIRAGGVEGDFRRAAYAAFEMALKPGAPLSAFERLIKQEEREPAP